MCCRSWRRNSTILLLADFGAVGQPNVAVCLLPVTRSHSTRVSNASRRSASAILPNKKIGQRLARFRQVNTDNPVAHHDALEFPDWQVVLVTRLPSHRQGKTRDEAMRALKAAPNSIKQLKRCVLAVARAGDR